jgi:hypothetical protein
MSAAVYLVAVAVDIVSSYRFKSDLKRVSTWIIAAAGIVPSRRVTSP